MGEYPGRPTEAFDARRKERELAREVLMDLANLTALDGERAEKKDDIFRVTRRVETLRQLGRVFALTGVKDAYHEAVARNQDLLKSLSELNLVTTELLRQQQVDELLAKASIWSPVTHVPAVDLVEAHRLGVLETLGVAKHADAMVRGRYALHHGLNSDPLLTPWNWNPEGEVMMSRGGRTVHGKGVAAMVKYTPEQCREAEKLIALRNGLHAGQGDEEEVLQRKVAFEEDLVRHMLHVLARAVHTRDLAQA